MEKVFSNKLTMDEKYLLNSHIVSSLIKIKYNFKDINYVNFSSERKIFW